MTQDQIQGLSDNDCRIVVTIKCQVFKSWSKDIGREGRSLRDRDSSGDMDSPGTFLLAEAGHLCHPREPTLFDIKTFCISLSMAVFSQRDSSSLPGLSSSTLIASRTSIRVRYQDSLDLGGIRSLGEDKIYIKIKKHHWCSSGRGWLTWMGILNQGDRNIRLDLANLAEVQSSWIWHLLHFLKSPGNGHKVTLSKT